MWVGKQTVSTCHVSELGICTTTRRTATLGNYCVHAFI